MDMVLGIIVLVVNHAISRLSSFKDTRSEGASGTGGQVVGEFGFHVGDPGIEFGVVSVVDQFVEGLVYVLLEGVLARGGVLGDGHDLAEDVEVGDGDLVSGEVFAVVSELLLDVGVVLGVNSGELS